MATCIETYLQAKAAADQQLEAKLATATSEAERDVAIQEYLDLLDQITKNYFNCRQGAGGSGS